MGTSSPEEGRESKSSKTETVDRNDLDAFSKNLLEKFLNTKNKTEAIEYLKAVKKDIGNLPPKTQEEYSKKIAILEQWLINNRGVFDERGIRRDIRKDTLKQVTESLGLKDIIIPVVNSPKKQKEIDDFVREYDIQKFKQTVYAQCVEHPFITNTWVFLNDYKKLKERVLSLGQGLPPEYAAIMGTVDNIRNSDIFARNTGKVDERIQKLLGNEGKVEEFKKNMQSFLDISIAQKKVLSMGDFDKYFNEESKLTEEERSIGNKKYEEIKQGVDSIQTKEEKLAFLSKKENELRRSGYSKVLEIYISTKLSALIMETRGLANNTITGQTGAMLNNLLSKTKESDIREQARKMSEQTHVPHFAHLNSKTGNYEVISVTQIAHDCAENIQNINKGLFQNLLSLTNWQEFFKGSMGNKSIAGVGWYIQTVKQDSALFVGHEDKKGFFIQTYEQTKKNQEVLLNKVGDTIRTGKFDILFPSLMKYPEIKNSGEIQQKIKEKDIGGAYNLLAGKISNGLMVKIMEDLEKDGNSLEKDGKKKLLDESVKWKGKIIKDINITVTSEEDIKYLKKLSVKTISTGGFTQEDIAFLLRTLPEGHQLRNFVDIYNQVEFGGSIKAQAIAAKKLVQKEKLMSTSKVLNEGQKEVLSHVSRLGGASSMNAINQGLYNKNADKNNAEQRNQFIEAKTSYDRIVATSMADLVKSPELSKEDRRDIVRTITDFRGSNEQIDKWIDTQVFISKYVEEKNFVDIVEKNAAYMNLGETKSIGDLYGMSKLDISNMSSENGSMKLSETTIGGFNSFSGMNELMNCRVEVGDNGVFTRTIRTPKGEIVAENIPLENIDSTIQQLGRFYALGLGVLAPYMKQVSSSIGKSRPDKISGLDGNFDIKEDEKFLKILAIMLYGNGSLPVEPNIPNLIRLFNRSGQENNPKYILRQKGVINDSGVINTIRLDAELQESSKKVS